MWEKFCEKTASRAAIATKRKAVVGEIPIRKPTNICKSIVEIDTNDLYPYSVCQPKPSKRHATKEADHELQKNLEQTKQSKNRWN